MAALLFVIVFPVYRFQNQTRIRIVKSPDLTDTLIVSRKPTASNKDGSSRKDNLIDTRTRMMVVGVIP